MGLINLAVGTSGDSNTWVQVAPIAISALALIVSTTTALIGRSSLRQSRIALMTEVRGEWAKLQSDWSVALILARGPSDYYSFAPDKLRNEVRQFARAVIEESDSEQRRAIELGYVANVRAVTGFLDLCAGLVLQGRLRSADVYTIFGPEITRHGAAIRWMCGLRPPIWRFDEVPEERGGWSWLSHLTISAFNAERERIQGLVDLLWAQSARSGDHYPHVLMRCARIKRARTGRLCRRRIRNMANLYGNRRLSWRLQVELLGSEYLAPRAFFQQGQNFYVDVVDWKCVRVGLWRLRATASFLSGYLFLPPRFLLLRRRSAMFLRRFSFARPWVDGVAKYLAGRQAKREASLQKRFVP